MTALAAALGGCADRREPEIAAEFEQRFAAPAPDWQSVPCPDRAARLPRLRRHALLFQEVNGRPAMFKQRLPIGIRKQVMDADLVGTTEDIRCVARDYLAADYETELNYVAGLPVLAAIHVQKGAELMRTGEIERGYQHVTWGLEIFAKPLANTASLQLRLSEMLDGILELVQDYPPPEAQAQALLDAVGDTALPQRTMCSGLRQELLMQSLAGFGGHVAHLRPAIEERFGPNIARALDAAGLGLRDRNTWAGFRRLHDTIAKHCESKRISYTIRKVATLQRSLVLDNPPIAMNMGAVTERLRSFAELADAQATLSVVLIVRLHRLRTRRYPKQRDILPKIRAGLKSPLNGKPPRVTIKPPLLTIERPPYKKEVAL